MEEKTFWGYAYGVFKDDTGVEHSYCNVYMTEDFIGEQSVERHFGGYQAKKYGATSVEIFSKLSPGSRVRCYFDSRGKVAYMQPIDKHVGGKD